MVWQAVELVNGRPPYQWKHGWIPVTPDAQAIKAKQKTGTATDTAPSSTPRPDGADLRPATRRVSAISRLQKEGLEDLEAGIVHSSSSDQFRKIEPEFRSSVKADKFTREEARALEEWSFGYDHDTRRDVYEMLNGQKRAGEKPSAQLAAIDRQMTSALAKSQTTRPVTVFRGIRTDKPLAAGDQIEDLGWQSTSYNPQVAAQFMDPEYSGDFSNAKLLIIEVPEGFNALMVDDEGGDLVEHELILGPKEPIWVTRTEGNWVYAEVRP
jgi:hypothetical protein